MRLTAAPEAAAPCRRPRPRYPRGALGCVERAEAHPGPCCRRVGGRRRPREACNLGRDQREEAEGASCREAGAPVVRGLRCRARRRASVV